MCSDWEGSPECAGICTEGADRDRAIPETSALNERGQWIVGVCVDGG